MHVSVVTRSRSRQEEQSEVDSPLSSPEELGQRIELDPLSEESLEDPALQGAVDEQRGEQREVADQEPAEEMAEARGPAITPPKFRGSIEENVEEYLQAFERVAKANGWDQAKRLVILPCYLEGAALKWYENMEQAEADALTWELAKRKMKEAFQSIAWEEQLEYKLRMRMQGEEETVESYLQDVLNLCTKLDAGMNERIKIKHVLRGLKPSLLEKVMLMTNENLEGLIANIKKVQTARFMAGQRVDHLYTGQEAPGVQTVSQPITPSPTSKLESQLENLAAEFSKLNMRLLGQTQQQKREPPEERRRSEPREYQGAASNNRTGGRQQFQRGGRTSDGRVICYKCNRVGHYAINCRSTGQRQGNGNEGR